MLGKAVHKRRAGTNIIILKMHIPDIQIGMIYMLFTDGYTLDGISVC